MKTITTTQVGLHCHTAVIFRRLAVFSFLAVTTLAEAVKPNYGGIFSAVMQYGGTIFWRYAVFRLPAVTSFNSNLAVIAVPR